MAAFCVTADPDLTLLHFRNTTEAVPPAVRAIKVCDSEAEAGVVLLHARHH